MYRTLLNLKRKYIVQKLADGILKVYTPMGTRYYTLVNGFWYNQQ